MRLRGLCRGRLAIGCLVGQYGGVVDGAVTKLFGVVSATFARYRRVGPEYEVVGSELAFFTDLVTGEALDLWTNPYTAESIQVPIARLPPMTMRIGTDLQFRSDTPKVPGLQFSQAVEQPMALTGEIAFVERVTAVRDGTASLPPFYYSDSTIMRVRTNDVPLDESVSVNCLTSFQSVVSWRPWMKMGARPGSMVGFGIGRYGATIHDLPAAWIRATQKFFPDVLTDPGLMLAGPK